MRTGTLTNDLNWILTKNEGSIRETLETIKLQKTELSYIKRYRVYNANLVWTEREAFDFCSQVDIWESYKQKPNLFVCISLEDNFLLFVYPSYILKPRKDSIKALLQTYEFEVGVRLDAVEKSTQIRGFIFSDNAKEYGFMFETEDQNALKIDDLEDYEILDTYKNRQALVAYSQKFSNTQLTYGWDSRYKEFVILNNFQVVSRVKRAIEGLSQQIVYCMKD